MANRDWSESHAMATFARLGYCVFDTVYNHQCDFLVGRDGRFKTVECKRFGINAQPGPATGTIEGRDIFCFFVERETYGDWVVIPTNELVGQPHYVNQNRNGNWNFDVIDADRRIREPFQQWIEQWEGAFNGA